MCSCQKCGRKPEKANKPLWKKILPVAVIVLILAAIGYAVYYFFFADEYEDLDEDFFADDAKETVPEERRAGGVNFSGCLSEKQSPFR